MKLDRACIRVTLFVVGFFCFSPGVFGYPLTPDGEITPGELCTEESKDFFEYRYEELIPYCKRNVSAGTKRAIYLKYAVVANEQNQYTIDHFIPLSLGGSNTPQNLWPEHHEVKEVRPTLEFELYVALRDGEMNQDEAIDAIVQAKLHPCDFKKYVPVTANRKACRVWGLRESGGGYANLVEPRTFVVEYPARWEKPRIDLDELEKLRRAGWRTKQRSERF